MASTLLEYLTDVHGAIVVLAEIEAVSGGPATARRGSTCPDDVPQSTPPTDRED